MSLHRHDNHIGKLTSPALIHFFPIIKGYGLQFAAIEILVLTYLDDNRQVLAWLHVVRLIHVYRRVSPWRLATILKGIQTWKANESLWLGTVESTRP